MLFSIPKNFIEALTPLFFFNCIAGMGAFRLPNQRITTYNCMKIYTVIHLLITWIAIYVTFSFITELRAAENTSPMALTMFKALVYVNGAIGGASPLLIWFRRKGVRDCMQRIAILEDTFRSILGAPNEYRQQYIYLTCQVVVVWIFMTFMIILDCVLSQWMNLKLYQASFLKAHCILTTLHQPIGVMLLLDINFCTSVRYLERKFRYLNDSLLQLVEKPSTYFPDKRPFVIFENAVQTISGNEVNNTKAGNLINEKEYLLREIRKAHLELCKLSRKINHIFGIQNLLSMGISFVMITGLLYTIYNMILWKNSTIDMFEAVFPSVLWTAIYICKIWMINHSCWSINNEAERTGEVLYELLSLRVDKELRKEMGEFGLQRLQNPICFNACGFFTLDYTFVQGVIGSITTYLIILIQLSPVPEGPVSG